MVGYLGLQAFEAIPAQERAGFTFRDPTAELIGAEAARLREAGADVVIGVSHTGFLADVADQEAGWPLDVVVAAHCHSPWSHWTTGDRHVAKPHFSGEAVVFPRAARDDECGRGLRLVHALSNEMDVEYHPASKQVWFCLAPAPATSADTPE